MPTFTTFKRWTLKDTDDEDRVLALIREAIIPAYTKLPGCLKLGLHRIEGTNSYLTTQHWESRAVYKEVMASPEYAKWREAYQLTLERWHIMMKFEDEWETEDVLEVSVREIDING
jgi:quinol monooxygenase YgiN